jgi:hypothetical protein
VSDFSNLPASSKGPILPGQVVWQPAERQVVPTSPEDVPEEPPEAGPHAPHPLRPFAVLTASGVGCFLLGVLLILTPHVVAEHPGRSDRFAYVGLVVCLIGVTLLVVGTYRACLALQGLAQARGSSTDAG